MTPSERVKQWRADNPERSRAYAYQQNRDYGKRLWAELLEAYGSKCSCCGEATPEFLTLDHVRGDGAAHRRAIGTRGGGRPVWAAVKREGFPPTYRILCFNCNCGRARSGGQCPHANAERHFRGTLQNVMAHIDDTNGP